MGTLIRINGPAIVLFFSAVGFCAFAGDTTQRKSLPFSFQAKYELLQKALDNYYDIQKNGGWNTIRATRKFYLKGQADPVVKQIKQRLRATGDFSSKDSSSVFTDELVKAVQRVQRRFGYKQNGVVDALLIKQLNVSVEDRIEQLLINMQRLQAFPSLSGTTLVANIPEYKLHVFEGSDEVFDMDIVVGAQTHQTEVFNDEMTHIVFSPYWNVPQSIVENEILPAMEANGNYLRNNGYEITGYENGLPVIRQKPGPHNSLGQVKFVFPNDKGIYFHDTPAKGLFQYPKRTFSHGCIRLAQPARLAAYLLKDSKKWSPQKIKEAMNSGVEQTVKLPQPVSVSLTYFTAWIDKEGQLQLREDIYGLDKKEAYKVAAR